MKKQGLIVRAPNWIGDTIYCIPVWVRLSEHYDLHIVGKGWLADLLSGYPEWHVYKLSGKTWQCRAQYVSIKKQLMRSHQLPVGVNTIVFPTSFGSAFEPVIAGLKVLGHAHEGRGFLLKQRVPMPDEMSSIYERYWNLGNVFYSDQQAAPKNLNFLVNPEVDDRVRQVFLRENGLIEGQYIVVCPFAAGNFDGQDKKWPQFAVFAEQLSSLGYPVVCCPAPNEEGIWHAQYSNVRALMKLSLSEYAAVLKYSKCVVANDTGPGHLASSVGAMLVSVLNRTKFETYGAVGERVSYVKHEPTWPTVEAVLEHLKNRLIADDAKIS